VYLQEPSVEPEVVELATETKLEIVSVEPSTSHGDKENKSGSSSGSAVSRSSASSAKRRKSSGGLALTAIDNLWLRVQLEEQDAEELPSSGEDSPPKL
ncbi:hypothetical protein LSH36_807g00074, partial [Paralvinella palmiformis]